MTFAARRKAIEQVSLNGFFLAAKVIFFKLFYCISLYFLVFSCILILQNGSFWKSNGIARAIPQLLFQGLAATPNERRGRVEMRDFVPSLRDYALYKRPEFLLFSNDSNWHFWPPETNRLTPKLSLRAYRVAPKADERGFERPPPLLRGLSRRLPRSHTVADKTTQTVAQKPLHRPFLPLQIFDYQLVAQGLSCWIILRDMTVYTLFSPSSKSAREVFFGGRLFFW